MKSTVKSILSSLVLVTLFVACAEPKQRSNNNDNQEKLGTGDSGGGNSCQGRPIESYAKDITQLSSYKKFIAPVLGRLSGTDGETAEDNKPIPHYDIARMLQTMVSKKTWYVIPCELQKISSERIGAAVPTEQAALQSFSEVWMSEASFSKMSEEDQAYLLMHEILMGLRILKFESSFNQCMSFASEADLCNGAGKGNRGTISKLRDSDYSDIRAAAVEILKNYKHYKRENWEDLFAKRRFNFPYRDFTRLDRKLDIKVDDFLSGLETAILTQKMPKYGYISYPDSNTKAAESCKVDFKVDRQTKRIDFSISSKSVTQNLAFDLKEKENLPLYGFEDGDRELYSVNLMGNKKGMKKGDRFFMMSVVDFVDGVELTEMVCTSDDCMSSRNVNDGLYYFCYSSPAISTKSEN